MKKLSLTMAMILITVFSFSQNIGRYLESQRNVIKSEKKEIVKDVLDLTNEQAKVFWPLYDAYKAEKKPFNTILVNTITEYMDKYDTMTDEDAERLFHNTLIVDESWVKLEKKYFRKMNKVLPAKKVVRYFQLESRLRAMILNDLTIDIPMVGDND